MPSTSLVRLGAIAALAAGVTWCLLSLLSLLSDDPRLYIDVLFIMPFTLTIGGVIGVHAVQHEQTGRLERFGFWLSIVGMVAVLVVIAAHIADLHTLRDLVVPVGMAAWVAGFVLFGIATARAHVLPVWCGVAIALSEPLTVALAIPLSVIDPLTNFGSYSGAVAHGVIWLAIGAVLWASRGVPYVSTQPDGTQLEHRDVQTMRHAQTE